MKKFILGALLVVGVLGCSDQKGPVFALSGNLAVVPSSHYVIGRNASPRSIGGQQTVTHVMAINPGSSNPRRVVAEVNPTTGAFSLELDPGRPYVLVFIATGNGLTGPDMIAGIFKIVSNDLDVVAPTAEGKADLGTVTLDGSTQQVTVSQSFSLSNFLASLGISADEAEYLGSIDNVSLRAANPDVDGNGQIDALEGVSFNQDWHIRANTKIGADGENATFADITGAYLNTSGDQVATLEFNLGSAYAVYPSSYDSSVCPASSGVSSELATGCAFGLTKAGVDDLNTWPQHSFSGGTFGGETTRQWGPDYDLTATSGQDLPGSSGYSVTMAYTLPNGHTLTFSHIRTRSKTTLTQDGVIMPFLKINTTDNTVNGVITSINYKWMKLQSGHWVDASLNEVELVVNENGGYVAFYTAKSSGNEEGIGFTIPRSSTSGTIPWASSSVTRSGAAPALTSLTPNSFCSSAVSYDDQLGLRIFAGGLAPNPGVTICP